jgi:hypothetical protein
MNCIDAIEGTAKSTLATIHEAQMEYRLDDTEYIRNVKTVIAGVMKFVQENPEVTPQPEMIRQVLYDFSKELWRSSLNGAPNKTTSDDTMGATLEADEYHDYYFDYIYTHGVYPQ